MNFWIDLFTGTTFTEFVDAGATISGFRERRKGVAKNVRPGDIFLCYMAKVQRWVGALEVEGTSDSKKKIWKDSDFPVRFRVKPIVLLKAETGIPMAELEGRVSFFSRKSDKGKYKGIVRASPNLLEREDGIRILELLHAAAESPVERPVDPKKFAYKPYFQVSTKVGKRTVQTTVSVPETEVTYEDGEVAYNGANFEVVDEKPATAHTEIQGILLQMGIDMGLDVWVARNDRNKIWNGRTFADLPRMVQELPAQFNEATQRTIELIDVLWLRANSIVAAFEVESTTTVYSGLLRMSDLLSLQPNLDINLFLLAPDERREKVRQEIIRPTFVLRPKPLKEVCGFVSFGTLKAKFEVIQKEGFAASLRPEYMGQVAEYFREEQ